MKSNNTLKEVRNLPVERENEIKKAEANEIKQNSNKEKTSQMLVIWKELWNKRSARKNGKKGEKERLRKWEEAEVFNIMNDNKDTVEGGDNNKYLQDM